MLVGTVSIENSEYLSEMLKRRGVAAPGAERQVPRERGGDRRRGRPQRRRDHRDQHGRPRYRHHPRRQRRTAATLTEWQAEHDKVVELGGLHIIGTERHESRRIDNQLRGRAGRQGDPGSSRFYVSFEDDLMRRFAPEWLPGMLPKLGMDEDVPIESGWVTKALENAQTKVEGHNFDIRKHVVEYDDVMNMHRDVIYTERTKVLEGADMRANVFGMVEEEIQELVAAHLPGRHEEAWDLELLLDEIAGDLPAARRR